jgi:hypothetical protein
MGAGEVWFSFHRDDSVRQDFAARARTGDLADVIREIDGALVAMRTGRWTDATQHLRAAARTAEKHLDIYGGEAGPSLDRLTYGSGPVNRPDSTDIDSARVEIEMARRRFLSGHQKAAVEYLACGLSLFESAFLEE